jgi:hypothetical protein
MDILKPEDIKKKFKGKFWVSPYKRIIAQSDGKIVELIEDILGRAGLFITHGGMGLEISSGLE